MLGGKHGGRHTDLLGLEFGRTADRNFLSRVIEKVSRPDPARENRRPGIFHPVLAFLKQNDRFRFMHFRLPASRNLRIHLRTEDFA